MYHEIMTLTAPENDALFIWFEPQAEGLGFSASTTVEIKASSDKAGKLDVSDSPESTVFYGWGGSTIQVLVDGETVKSFDIACPDFLTGDMIKLLFGEPPAPSLDERAALK